MEQTATLQGGLRNRMKFLMGGALIIAAVIYLIVSSTKASAQYFMTIKELQEKGAAVATTQDLRISGAIIGSTIQYDVQTLTLTFTVADIPGDNKEIEAQGGLGQVLHNAVIDPSRPRLQVVYNGVKPDLMRDEAQAIMTGRIGQDGKFYAQELLLKCPTKYEEAVPDQVEK
jgi:cytochrome c-type biogenesis protein CcmE